MQRRTTTIVLITAGGVAACVATAASERRSSTRKPRRGARRWERPTAGRLKGWAQRMDYLLNDGHPDANVPDLVLADRIRSTIGPLEKQLDLPHIHVMVNDRTALLHGDVATIGEAARLEDAVGRVAGVSGVESFLHIGLLASDTRPSEGRSGVQPLSDALSALLKVATRAGGGRAPAALVRAVLSIFLEAVPVDERRHVLSHLPDDVCRLADPPRRFGLELQPIGRASDLFDAIAAAGPDLDLDDTEDATIAVLSELARLIPEEADDMAATLPHELRDLWLRARAIPDDATAAGQANLHALEQV